ncbi:VOC family protein [Saccharothrix hoggarensis]|uniref:VOC family protein n=1 Tax=Saccharothrix hoggarensis TaxID=913853 RepID=A0ABW3QSX3_9PSEU
MTDPFEGLRLPVRAVDPDPAFADRLRERLEREVLIGGGEGGGRREVDAVSGTRDDARHAQPSAGEPMGAQRDDAGRGGAGRGGAQPESGERGGATYATVVPYLAVRDARAAIDFYVEVFGATRRGEVVVMDDGSVGHAEIAIGDSVLMLAEESAEYRNLAPGAGGVHPMHRVEVSDVDATVRRAVAGGGTVLRATADTGHGYGATLLDPFGYRWMVAARTEADPTDAAASTPTGAPPHGHVAYHTLTVPDDEAAKRFYGAVLGWRFAPGRVEHGWQVEGTGLPAAGLWGGQGRGGWKLMYAVDDLATAVARVREHGGTANEPERLPYGLSSECVDDQGVEFWLWQR